MSQTALEKFQQLLRELFEFDMADLDFGIYRIMNHKRTVIERWIIEDLPNLVRQELQQGTLVSQQKMLEELDTVREEIQKTAENLGEKPFDADGNLLIWQDKPIGKKYIELREKAIHARNSQALEAAVYNHLYTFFSRYWQEGDFISKRRYSKKERYAIPYNGEEVYLYWANHDQYYVKTGEYFTDYTWKAPNGVSVHFKIKAADVEQNNVKGEKRFFLPVPGEISWDENARTLTIPFEYRPLTKQEETSYGKQKIQEKIIEEALQSVPARLRDKTEALAALHAERLRADDARVTYLEHHLRQYTARNTRDFFIHKDLRGFLSRELDFYLKNEVLNLEEMEAAGENLAEGWFQLLRLIKRIGNHIIEFLAQVEDFQKMLWEKKKFVTETFYVITLGNIPESFYADIAACEAQWEEWRELLSVQAPKNVAERIDYLKQHPTLPLDTRHFPQDFTDRLLASFENLDEMTDGLLVNSENWQALNLLQEKYKERVKCIYIDPPYNTGNDEFLYRDNYQHSSWLAMMEDRLNVSRYLLSQSGFTFVNIDDNEEHELRFLLDRVMGRECFCNAITWAYGTTARGAKAISSRLPRNYDTILLYEKESGKASLRKVTFPYRVKIEEASAAGFRRDQNGRWFKTAPRGDYTDESIELLRQQDRVYETEAGNMRIKYFLREENGFVIEDKLVGDVWTDIPDMMHAPKSERCDFDTQKPLSLLNRVLSLALENNELCIDYFAGSGTMGHAVINLNREDGGRRKFILVEMADYFDTVLLPRIKKVTFTPEWKDGKPKRMATAEEAERSPRIVKVIRLESYEDALNNLTFDEESGQQALELFRDEYLLSYMLKWETRRSETLLNVEKLQNPFSYKLRIHRDGETREQPVDLPETFAYLIGLDVEKRQVLDNDGKRYLVYRGTTREGRRTAVIWRETSGWTEDDYRRDRDFVTAQKLTEGADDIFVNGDSLIPGARALEAVFKAKMFGQTEF
ncbi:MAG: site-specific DNA-methyltransferase [Chloroflexota bacterium]